MPVTPKAAARARQVSVLRPGDGFVHAPSPTLTALLDAVAATLPGYGSIPFILDEELNIAQGLIHMVGVGKIVRRDKPPLAADVIA